MKILNFNISLIQISDDSKNFIRIEAYISNQNHKVEFFYHVEMVYENKLLNNN